MSEVQDPQKEALQRKCSIIISLIASMLLVNNLGSQNAASTASFLNAAAINVLEKLQRFKGNDPRAELLFSTHPSPSERLDMLLQAGIDKLPRPAAKPNPNRQARFQKFIEAI